MFASLDQVISMPFSTQDFRELFTWSNVKMSKQRILPVLITNIRLCC